jgi:hypothetical protein
VTNSNSSSNSSINNNNINLTTLYIKLNSVDWLDDIMDHEQDGTWKEEVVA